MDRRRLAFAAGLALVAIALLPPLHTLSFDLLTAHLLQNVLLAEWAPLLLALGLAPEIGRRAAARIPLWLGLPAWAATYYAWHTPALYDAALRHPGTLLELEHATYLAAGLLFWVPLVHGTWPDTWKAGTVFAAFLVMAPLGFLLTLLPKPAYAYYAGAHGLDALTDQQLAGILMSSAEALAFFGVFGFYVRRAMREAG